MNIKKVSKCFTSTAQNYILAAIRATHTQISKRAVGGGVALWVMMAPGFRQVD